MQAPSHPPAEEDRLPPRLQRVGLPAVTCVKNRDESYEIRKWWKLREMMVQVYGFNWEAYAGVVMPAFTRWLVEGDENSVYQLYQHTRCAREEQYIPPMLCPARTWTRALTFVQKLPRGAHIREEYKILCDPEQFTAMSDQYTYRHIPQLYSRAEALRAVWGAVVAEYCQSCLVLPEDEGVTVPMRFTGPLEYSQGEAKIEGDVLSSLPTSPLEPVSLKRPLMPADPLPDYLLSQESEQMVEDMGGDTEKLPDDVDVQGEESEQGVQLGRHPATLPLRGWLASRSIRAMALFELLACGRRAMPFGCRTGEPYEDYIGYLTPGEVKQLADCLRNEPAPARLEAEADYVYFRREQSRRDGKFRLIDEVLPTHAGAFLCAVRMAAQYELGLVCRVE